MYMNLLTKVIEQGIDEHQVIMRQQVCKPLCQARFASEIRQNRVLYRHKPPVANHDMEGWDSGGIPAFSRPFRREEEVTCRQVNPRLVDA